MKPTEKLATLMLLTVAAICAACLCGCITQSDVSNDSNDRAAGIYMPIGSLDVSMPEMPAPVEGEESTAFKSRLKAWVTISQLIADAISQVKLPETLTGLTISDIKYWKDQRGTGGAETRARGEGGIDAAVGLGGSTVDKATTTDDDETVDEDRTETTELGDNTEAPVPD